MKTKYLFMDVDGTLTDGKIYIGENGEVMKAFSVKDGQGLSLIRKKKYGVIPVVLTGRNSLIVQKRCDELKIQRCHQKVKNKKEKLKEYAEKASPASFSFIGDDINDLPAMKYVKRNGGMTGCPSDATNAVKAVADYICENRGGDGAVREFIDYLIETQS